MNQIIVDKLALILEQEICPTHEKSASIKGVNSVIVIEDYCCEEFYKYLQKRLQEEIDRLTYSI